MPMGISSMNEKDKTKTVHSSRPPLSSQPKAQVQANCPHSVRLRGLCTLCGKDISAEDSENSSAEAFGTENDSETFMNILPSHPHLLVSATEAARLGRETKNRLLAARKLSLVVDLDQTVLHASIDPIISHWLSSDDPELLHLRSVIHTFTLDRIETVYYLKLRPGLHEFLEIMNQYYEMHIYTMGTRAYAEAITKIIDPQGTYFGDRVLTRDISGNHLFKDLKKICPMDDSMIVIVDDRVDVWNWVANLVQVKPYNFFLSGDPNAPEKLEAELKKREKKVRGELLTEDEKEPMDKGNETTEDLGVEVKTRGSVPIDNDSELVAIEKILRRIHRLYYQRHDAGDDVDVKTIMSSLKSRILTGTHLTFSGIIPLEQQPYSSILWRTALEFGAECSKEIGPNLTHLIAGNMGTKKAYMASRMEGVDIVKVEWFWDSIHRWEKKDEREYLLFDRGPRKQTTSQSNNEDDSQSQEEFLNLSTLAPIDEGVLKAMNKEAEEELLTSDEEESAQEELDTTSVNELEKHSSGLNNITRQFPRTKRRRFSEDEGNTRSMPSLPEHDELNNNSGTGSDSGSGSGNISNRSGNESSSDDVDAFAKSLEDEMIEEM